MPIEETRCPICHGRMRPRTNTQNGRAFWGCVDYPACKGTRDTDGRSAAERAAERRSTDADDDGA